jgi:hypothetical protein
MVAAEILTEAQLLAKELYKYNALFAPSVFYGKLRNIEDNTRVALAYELLQ